MHLVLISNYSLDSADQVENLALQIFLYFALMFFKMTKTLSKLRQIDDGTQKMIACDNKECEVGMVSLQMYEDKESSKINNLIFYMLT